MQAGIAWLAGVSCEAWLAAHRPWSADGLVVASFYKNPLEILANGLLSSTIVYAVVGLGPVAGAHAVLLTGVAELFYHWNVRTPRCVGWLVQRPEMHCIHHERGRHASNYADLPLGTCALARRFPGVRARIAWPRAR